MSKCSLPQLLFQPFVAPMNKIASATNDGFWPPMRKFAPLLTGFHALLSKALTPPWRRAICPRLNPRLSMKTLACLLLMGQTAMACVDLPQTLSIGQSIAHTYYELLCTKPLTKQVTKDLLAHSLPQIMTPSFLGTPPPPHWNDLINWWLEQCDWEGSLCTEEAQQQFVYCSQKLSPLMLIELMPWFEEHCEALNQHLIQNWSKREPQLRHIIQRAFEEMKA